MKSAGKARSNGLYRHIRTSKEIIRNLLNDLSNIICDNHSQENKKTLADIVFVRTNSATYIHRTDDLL